MSWNTSESKCVCVCIWREIGGFYLRKNLKGAELDLQFDFRIGASVVLFTSTGTLSLAKTSQPIIIDSYEGQEVNIPCNHTTIAIRWIYLLVSTVPQPGTTIYHSRISHAVENEVASLLIPPDRKFSTLSLPGLPLGDALCTTASSETHTATDGAAAGQ